MTRISLKDIFSLASDVVSLATERDLTIATAESCTGGLIGAAITSIPGSSAPFKGGIIAYDNAVKANQLDVPEAIIETHGAVSEEVAEAMAQGVLTALETDLAISVTGIAGPGGGSEEKPIGTVWIGLAQKSQPAKAALFNFGDIGRNKVRDVTCYEALKALKAALSQAQ
ncbi:CinA family protein [Litorimonas haliclonae]|uniref:CinA family protein n=1 Tax=Litorimonas haliclonae TaxID=2081977 RepID=UPI0039F0B92C